MKSLFASLLLALATTVSSAPSIEIQTNLGRMLIELDSGKAPVTVANFLKYVKDGHYDGTIFHRVINGFMIQGGGYTPAMEEKKTGQPIRNESQNGLKNLRGTIAMARRPDPDSATAQFFINHKDNAGLDFPRNGGYTVFGKLTQGIDVLDKIAKTPTANRGMHQDVPVEPVLIQAIKLLSDK